MNLLPLVSSFLLVFALIASSFLKDYSVTKNEEATYLSYMATSQKMLNDIETTRYNKAQKNPKNPVKKGDPNTSPQDDPKPSLIKTADGAVEDKEKPTPEKMEEIDKPKIVKATNPQKDPVQPEKPDETQEDATKAKKPNKRAAKNLTQIENAKFNLTPLLTDRESKAGKRRYKTAARLIKNLYGDAPFFDRRPEEKFEEFILDKMLEQGDLNVKNKKNITNENATLFDIFPAEEKYHRLFYKIFQGTKRYMLEKNEKSGKKLGYPPLHHFFTYKPQETKIIINFQDTSKAVLDAHFGEEICKKILEEEESVWKSEKRLLQMGDLQKLLQNADHGVTVDERLDGLELKKATKQKKKFLSSQDDKTGIVIERINNIPE